MKYLYFIFLVSYNVVAQTTFIPDDNFEEALIERGIDSDGIVNQQVLTSDIIDVIELNLESELISDLTGIQDFQSLEILNCADGFLQSVDLSNNLMLRILDLSSNRLSEIDLSTNTELEVLRLVENELISLDVTNNVNLEELFISNTQFDSPPFNSLISLNLENNENLEVLSCEFVGLEELNVNGLVALRAVNCALNDFNEIDFSNNVLLETLIIGEYSNNIFDFTSSIEHLDLSNNPSLSFLRAPNTLLRKINLGNGNNNLLEVMEAGENDFLECIEVDDADAASNSVGVYSSWVVPDGVSFTEDDCVLGLEDEQPLSFTVYPNPVQDYLNIQTSTSVGQLIIRDTLGKIIYEKENNEDNIIDLKAFPSGLYFVSIISGASISSRKIIKQ